MAKRKQKFTTGLWSSCPGRRNDNSLQIWHVEPGSHKIGDICSWFTTVSAHNDIEAIELGQFKYAKYLENKKGKESKKS